jgi:superfamily II DNA or RNA helicase
MARELFPYQRKMVDDGDAARAQGHRHLLYLGPTGSGKTDVMAFKVKRAHEAFDSTLILAERREIVFQIRDRLQLYGVEAAGIIMDGEPHLPLLRTQIASVQTFRARALDRRAMDLPAADWLCIDECHHAVADTYRRIMEAYPNAARDGYTATAGRGDGRGLGDIFDAIVAGPTVHELVDLGRLVPTRFYAPVNPDLAGVRTRQGEYVTADLEDRLNRPKIVGDIAENLLKYGERRQTIIYAVSVGHAVAIRDALRDVGVRAEYVCGATPEDERAALLAMLAGGEIQVIVNCMVLVEGFDCPPVSCIVLARPTKSLVLYIQMVGRGLRAHDGKADCIVIDHSGAVFRHGMPDDEIAWVLSPDDKAVNTTHERRQSDYNGNRIVECSQCGAMRTAGEPCDACGFYPPQRPKHVAHVNGDLGLVDRQRRVRPQDWSHDQRMDFWGQLAGIAEERGYKAGWVAHKFKEKFGTWPPGRQAPAALDPTPEVRAWVRSRIIAWAKSQERGAA